MNPNINMHSIALKFSSLFFLFCPLDLSFIYIDIYYQSKKCIKTVCVWSVCGSVRCSRLRSLQCLRRYYDSGKRHPNLPNAFKYSLSMLVTLTGIFNPSLKQRSGTVVTPFQYFYLTVAGISTIYSWLWDVFQDWNLFDSTQPGFIRKRRILSNTYYYYLAIIMDLVFRIFWTWTLIPNGRQTDLSIINLYIAPFSAMAEIFRRTMWSFFRLENEQLNNTAGYRKSTHIPLHYETPKQKKKNILSDVPEVEDTEKRRQIRFEILAFFIVVVFFVAASIVANS